jgi:lipid II:glycine glycyltransferase (peptidoglycan interpeptide bridge formation enzyme)
MTIHTSFSDINPEQWQQLVAESPHASFFQTPECYRFFSTLSFLKPFVYGVSENDKLKGIIVGFLISDGLFLKKFLSRRAIVSGGALLHPDILVASTKSLLEAVKEGLKHKAIYLEFRNYSDYSAFVPAFQSSGFELIPHLNFHVPTPSVDVATQKLKASKRRYLKLSVKEGVEWVETRNANEIKEFYAILENLYKTKIKTPLFPLEFFIKLNELPQAKLLVVKHNGKIIGGSQNVLLPNRTVFEWFVCGLDGQIKNVYPSIMATWAGIEYAASHGFQIFDMMGAGKPNDGYGVRDFKAEFGGDLVEHGRLQFVFNKKLFNIGKYGIRKIQTLNKPKKQAKSDPKQLKSTLENQSVRIVNDISQINQQDWSEFVQQHPLGNIFQTPEMYRVFDKTKGQKPIVTLAIDSENRIIGCLVSVIQKEQEDVFGLFTSRSVVIGGPLVQNNDSQIADLLLSGFDRFVEKKVIYSQFRNLIDMSHFSSVFLKNGYNFVEHLNILLDLTLSESELYDNLHKERRRNILQAQKNELEFKLITSEEDKQKVIQLLKKTYCRVKVPLSYETLFFNANNILGNKIVFFGAFYQGKMIAGQVRLCYKELVYAWYAGSDSAYFDKRPNDFLTWQVMLWSKANNYKVFDFGGAGNPTVDYGVRNYKMKFGGELVHFGRFEKTHKTLFMFIGRKLYRLYKKRKKI